ncbi:MAG: transposase, partial [Aureispira sp.]|nr:transposase [Aureispira sp.]
MKKEKQKRVNRQYDEGFKKQALELVSGGRTVAAVAKSLGIKAGVLYSW